MPFERAQASFGRASQSACIAKSLEFWCIEELRMRRRGSYDDTTAAVQPDVKVKLCRDLFPNSVHPNRVDVGLVFYVEKQHLRGLAQRRRSAPNLVLGKALGMSWSPIREEGRCPVAVDQSPFVLGLTGDDSELILEESAQLSEGLKTRERHLFLLSDALVIAKLRSHACYRLKHRVELKDLWVCGFENEEEEEVEDEDVDLRTSFVLAWSASLCLVTFRQPELKHHWLETLLSKTAEARSLARSFSPLPCVLMKVLSGNSTNKTLMDSDLPLDGNSKNSALLKQFHNQEAQAQHSVDNGGRKTFFPFKLKRSSTSPSVPVRAESAGKNLLFGRNLQDEPVLPKPIAEILLLLFRKGPSTEGVFRVSCNNKNLNALRDQLNSGAVVDMEALPVTLLVGVLKIFLKELPGGLLVFELFESWMKALEKETAEDIRSELRRMVEKLPKANSLLLQHLLCLFHHISQRSETNKMDAKNLAVCIAPTLLHRDSQTLDVDEVEKVTKLIQFLTENCCEIFGDEILVLLGDLEGQEFTDTASSMSPDISFEVQQQDSAYDSTDPEVDLECVAGESQVQEDRFTSRRNQGLNRIGCSGIQSCSSDAIFDAFTKSCNRRRSEPSILSSASMMGLRELARSHDDFSLAKTHFDEQLLKKQNSDDSFLQPNHSENSRAQITFKKLVGSLNMDLPIGASSAATKASSCPSFCSTESTSSNHSEKSVPQSPTPSPANPRKSQSTRHSSFLIKIRHNHSQGDLEVNHRSLSARAKSLGNFTPSRGSLRKGESQKEVTFPCETLQEDLQNETEKVDELVRRRRPLSAIEVFQQVDSRTPCNPPSYEQALQNGAQPAPPKYRAMTVKHARELNRKSRPTSMNDCLLDIYNGPTGIDENFTESSGLEEPKTASFRQRAMSESVSQARHERVSRRCSQPVFEEFSYAKESYV